MRQIYPVQGPELELSPAVTAGPLPAAVAELAALYGNGAVQSAADRPWLRANMVASTDGAAALEGRSGTLSGPADRMVFFILRSLADVILVGASTVRTERYGPVRSGQIWSGLRRADAPVPAIAVVTASLDLDPDSPLLTGAAPQARTIVITTQAAPTDRKAAIARHARVIEVGREAVPVRAAITALSGLGYKQILTEGGPNLLGQFIGAGLLDELCLTTSPVLTAGQANRIVAPRPGLIEAERTGPVGLELAHVLVDDGYLLSRYLCAH